MQRQITVCRVILFPFYRHHLHAIPPHPFPFFFFSFPLVLLQLAGVWREASCKLLMSFIVHVLVPPLLVSNDQELCGSYPTEQLIKSVYHAHNNHLTKLNHLKMLL